MDIVKTLLQFINPLDKILQVNHLKLCGMICLNIAYNIFQRNKSLWYFNKICIPKRLCHGLLKAFPILQQCILIFFDSLALVQ